MSDNCPQSQVQPTGSKIILILLPVALYFSLGDFLHFSNGIFMEVGHM